MTGKRVSSYWKSASTALGDLARPGGLRRSAVYLEDVEALRGVAIALVFTFHYEACILGTEAGAWVSPWYAFVAAGHTGVSLFFILSGFLLAGPFLSEAVGGARVARRAYYRRRALRILPLYYAAVLTATALRVRDVADLRSTAAALLFLNHFEVRHALMPYSAVWWSLATEVQFYLVLPLLPLLARRRRAVIAALVASASYLALVGGYLHWHRGQPLLVFGLLGRGPLFAFGIAIAWFYQRRSRTEPSAWLARGGADLALLALLLALGCLLRWVVSIGPFEADANFGWWHVPEGALWTGVLWLVLTAPLHLRRLFSNLIFRVLGVLSYSIYIIHYPLMDLSLKALRGERPLAYLGWNPRTAIAGVVLAVLCVALSMATYLCIERPFLARKARLDR